MISELVYCLLQNTTYLGTKTTYLGTKNNLFGYKKTYLGTKNDLFGYKKTIYLGTKNNLFGYIFNMLQSVTVDTALLSSNVRISPN